MMRTQAHWLYLHHPAIIEERRNKFKPPLPPQPTIPQTIIPEPPPDEPPKKIKNTIKKKSKDMKVEIIEPPKEETTTISRKKATTIKPKDRARVTFEDNADDTDDVVVDLSKKIKTINIKPAANDAENSTV